MKLPEPKKPPGLMLTSLLDMFTIILIFLIVSFEAEDFDFQLNSDLTLPESTARSVFKPAVNIAITPLGVVVDKTQVVSLVNGRTTEAFYAEGEIPDLVVALKTKFEEIDVPDDEERGDDDPAVILVQADKGLDYQTIYLVLRSASAAGFVRYRLAVFKK